MRRKRKIGITMMMTGALMLVWVVSTVSKEAARIQERNTTNILVAAGDAVIKEARALATTNNDPKTAFKYLSQATTQIVLPANVKIERDKISFSYVSIKYPQDKVTLYIDSNGAFNARAVGFKIIK